MPAYATSFAISAGFFFAFVVGKTAIWGAQHAVTVTGVKDAASP